MSALGLEHPVEPLENRFSLVIEVLAEVSGSAVVLGSFRGVSRTLEHSNLESAKSKGKTHSRSTLNNNFIVGISAGAWRKLLKRNSYAVDREYLGRTALISLLTPLNSALGRIEKYRLGEVIKNTDIAEPPVFILGHWRSGTTHLHNLLALDREHFSVPTTFQVIFPNGCLIARPEVIERVYKCFGVRPETRPMDNMPVGFELPQEDELAYWITTTYSPMGSWFFPRHQALYDKYLTWREADANELEEWKEKVLWFLKKLTYANPRRLVLKSPPHTARVRVLLEMFPDARFIHVHRNPYDVFLSFRHLYDTLGRDITLQRMNMAAVEAEILRRYAEMYDAFFEDRGLIADGHYHEIGFEDLERNPLGEMKKLYDALGFEGFASIERKLQVYLDSLKSYRRNRYGNISERLRNEITSRWRRTINEWGYQQAG